MIIAMVKMCNMNYIMDYEYNLMGSRPTLTYVVFMFATIFIGVPLNVLMLFLGSYTRRKLLRIWSCIPLLKGLGYTMLMVHNLQLIYSQFFATYLIYLYSFSREGKSLLEKSKEWRECSFKEADADCFPVGIDTFKCVKDKPYELGLSQYIRAVVFDNINVSFVPHFSELSMRMVVINSVLWIIMGVLSFFGLRRILKIYNVLFTFTLVMRVIVYLATFFNAPKMLMAPFELFAPLVKSEETLFKNPVFWMKVLMHATGAFEIGSMIWLGSLKPLQLKPNFVTVNIFIFKLVALFLNMVAARCAFDAFIATHKTVLEGCKLLHQPTTIMVLEIEMITTFAQSQLWYVLFMFSEIFYTILDNILLVDMILDSLVDKFQVIFKNRLTLCLIFTVFNFGLSIILLSGISFITWFLWIVLEAVVIRVLVFCILSIAFNYVYSLEMLANDYMFTHGDKSFKFIETLWSATSTISLSSVALCFFWLSLYHDNKFSPIMIVIILLVTLVLFFPVIFFFVITIGNGLSGNYAIDKPRPSWGSFKKEIKTRRDLYVISKDLCYRHTTITCTHLCLLKVAEFEKERKMQYKKFEEAHAKVYTELFGENCRFSADGRQIFGDESEESSSLDLF